MKPEKHEKVTLTQQIHMSGVATQTIPPHKR